MKRQRNIYKTTIYIIFNGEEWIFPKDKDMDKWDQDDNRELSLIFWYFGSTKISLYTFLTLISFFFLSFFGLCIYNLVVRFININIGLFGRNSGKIKGVKGREELCWWVSLGTWKYPWKQEKKVKYYYWQQ